VAWISRLAGGSGHGIGHRTSSSSVSVVLHIRPPIGVDGPRQLSRPWVPDVLIVLHTIPLLAATCLAGFAMLQLLFSAGSW